jgi:hypothetical protein
MAFVSPGSYLHFFQVICLMFQIIGTTNHVWLVNRPLYIFHLSPRHPGVFVTGWNISNSPLALCSLLLALGSTIQPSHGPFFSLRQAYTNEALKMVAIRPHDQWMPTICQERVQLHAEQRLTLTPSKSHSLNLAVASSAPKLGKTSCNNQVGHAHPVGL